MSLLPLAATIATFFLPTVWAAGTDELLIPLTLPSEESLLPKPSIPKENLLRDIEDLELVFEKGYGGWPIFKSLFVNQTFPALKKLDRDFYSTKEFCEHIGRALDAVPDNHLSA